jgi:arylsulfatase
MSARPNIVLILADDMGYSDIGCYGGEIDTPALDGLAARGVRFTHFYNGARCCPARASLLTGLHPHQAGMGWMTAADLGSRGYVGDLNIRCATIAEALRPAGYGTYMAGKWHLTYVKYCDPNGPRHSWPLQRGFDDFYGTLAGSGSYFGPATLMRGNDRVQPGPDFYYTDAIAEASSSFIERHRTDRPRDPFFLYVAFTAPHWPLHARPDDITRFRGRYLPGWDVLRLERHRRMLRLGLLDPRWTISDRDPEVQSWDGLTKPQRDESDLRMAIYAAQVHAMDRGIGRIAETLRAGGILDDTVLLFMSDNGGCHEEVHRGQPHPEDIGTDRSFESYGRPWANLSNTPFREFKSWVHEGGISTPLVVHWPAGIRAPGTFSHALGHFTDIMPTCLELAGASYPPPSAPEAQPLQGVSLLPLFGGEDRPRGSIFWEHEGNRALRSGKWKLAAKGLYGRWELYDMLEDRTERVDLSKEYPDVTRALVQEWIDTAMAIDVFPLDGRRWSPRIDEPLVPPR